MVLDLDLLAVHGGVDLWAAQILQIFQSQASIDPSDARDCSHSLPQETLAA